MLCKYLIADIVMSNHVLSLLFTVGILFHILVILGKAAVTVVFHIRILQRVDVDSKARRVIREPVCVRHDPVIERRSIVMLNGISIRIHAVSCPESVDQIYRRNLILL